VLWLRSIPSTKPDIRRSRPPIQKKNHSIRATFHTAWALSYPLSLQTKEFIFVQINPRALTQIKGFYCRVARTPPLTIRPRYRRGWRAF
jgi:hypothetical protein